MSDTFTLPGGGIVAEITPTVNSVYATGNPDWPLLVFTLQMTFHGPSGAKSALEFRELRCRIAPFDASYIGASLPATLRLWLASKRHVSKHLVHLEVPIDRIRIASIERLRKGGDVILRLDMEMVANEVMEIDSIKGVPTQSIWGIKENHLLKAHTQIHVPRSQWVERILPASGFGKVHILELPVIPLENCAGMRISFEALTQAVKLESMGFYNETVAQCRIALEPFFEMAQEPDGKGSTKQRRALKAAWQTRLGQRTYDWLNGAFLAVNQATNQPHHPSSSNFDQMEAQMLLMITNALVSYAIKTHPPALPS